MKKIIKNITLLSSIFATTGCSIYSAINAPEPVNYKELYLGESRINVLSMLGQPIIISQNKNNSTSDYFEFIDGYDNLYKFRALPYLAGDVFTCGLAEIIFFPLEKFKLEGSRNIAVVNYDADSKVNEINVTRKNNGEVLYSIKTMQPTQIKLK